MRSSLHAPRQRNSTYRQTVIKSIYNTIWPEHPNSTICWSTNNSPRYLLFITPLHVIYDTYTHTYIPLASLPMARLPLSHCHFFKSPPIIGIGSFELVFSDFTTVHTFICIQFTPLESHSNQTSGSTTQTIVS